MNTSGSAYSCDSVENSVIKMDKSIIKDGEFVDFSDIGDSEMLEVVFQFEENMEDGVLVHLSEDSEDDGPSMAKVRKFCKDQEKPNTRKATDGHLKTFSKWLATEKSELRPIEFIPPKELNRLMAQFFVFVRKSDGKEYQPGTLLNMLHSYERHLKECRYVTEDNRISILKDCAFEDTRQAVNAKRRELKKQGMGNRPHRAVSVDQEEENILWDKGVLGISTPFSLQFTIWFYFTMLMGLRGRDEHRSIRFGDVQLKIQPDGSEYIELNERASKTRDGSVSYDSRATIQKIFCSCDSGDASKCVIEVWKKFVSHRPVDFCGSDDPLYLQYKMDDHIKKSNTPVWFKQQPLGANSLGKFLPKACVMAGLEPRGNHGVRATTVQRLRKAGLPDDQIIQITGHKSVRTLSVYDTEQLSSDVHKKCQGVLQTNYAAGSADQLEQSSCSGSLVAVTTSGSAYSAESCASMMSKSVVSTFPGAVTSVPSMFSGAIFNQCVFNIASAGKSTDNNEQ